MTAACNASAREEGSLDRDPLIVAVRQRCIEPVTGPLSCFGATHTDRVWMPMVGHFRRRSRAIHAGFIATAQTPSDTTSTPTIHAFVAGADTVSALSIHGEVSNALPHQDGASPIPCLGHEHRNSSKCHDRRTQDRRGRVCDTSRKTDHPGRKNSPAGQHHLPCLLSPISAPPNTSSPFTDSGTARR